MYILPIWGAKTPERINGNFFGGNGLRRNQAIQIWWRLI